MQRRGGKAESGKVARRPKVRTKAGKGLARASVAELEEQLRQRSSELEEALQQQTATSEVLSIIRRSPADAQPVFEAIVQSATRLCDAVFSVFYLYDNNRLRIAALKNFTPEATNQIYGRQELQTPNRAFVGGRAVLDRAVALVPDVLADPDYSREFALAGGWRAVLAVPLLRDGKAIGAITVGKAEPNSISEREIQLLKTFADQAVIAIENVRLFDEAQTRARDLSKSLEQQTATADVLKVISRSTFDLKTVLDTLVKSAVRLCRAEKATIVLLRDGIFQYVASGGFSPELIEYMQSLNLGVHRGSITGRAVCEGKAVHVPDVLADAEFSYPEAQKIGKFRTALAVPLLREGVAIGAIFLSRENVEPFGQNQIELVETFADQAVIAIENVRLFDEVQLRTEELTESLQQQTATADVLKVISRSTFDLRAVLQTLVESAARLSEADKTQILRPSETEHGFYPAASYGYTQEYNDYLSKLTFPPGREGVVGRVQLERRPVQIVDVLADPDYSLRETQRLGGFRTHLGVPLLREGNPIGVLVVSRVTVKPFTEKQIELLTTFADQAVIAIENVRLFESVQTRTRELAESLEDLRNTQDRLVQTQKVASLGQLTAGIAHEMKNPLNFVNNFSTLSAELVDELNDTLKGLPFSNDARAQLNELTDTLRDNLEKVVHHGQRADTIVKNMLLHSRELSSEHRRVDINAIVEESLKLAWHGARAEKQGFEIAIERSLDPTAGEVDVFPQDVTRALLNVIANGFYAARKRKTDADSGGYEPTLAASTKNLGDRVEIRIRDNGTGMPADVKAKMFDPFFTTKPAGEGTGLGLSISHDIIVKQHAGSIEVETRPGEFTEIRVILPRSAVFV